MQAITIVARSHVPFAAVLAESFREHNPGAEFVALVVDAVPGEFNDESETTFITPADLALDPDEFGRMALLYDIAELSTALKPWALQLLLDRGAGVAVYLDPAIFVYSSLSDVEQLSGAHGVVLTPHTTSPMPRDGKRPNEADVMAAGVYNLGFIAVDRSSVPMLNWWQERLLRDSLSDQTRMLATVQRWVDLVPGYFRHVILNDPGYNVAHWNLDQRVLARADDGSVLVNGRPLRFFHFSGYRPEKPWMLSTHIAQDARIVLSEHALLRELCDAYGELVLKAGIEAATKIPYRFAELHNNIVITPAIRQVYRAAVLDADRDGRAYPPGAFGGDDNQHLLDWLLGPVAVGSRVSRALHGVWQLRADLQVAFPNPFGSDELGLLLWGADSAVAEGWLPPELAPNELEITLEHRSEVAVRSVPGVNVAGYFQAELGVGQIGRLLVDAVRETGLPYSTWRSTRTVSRQLAGFDDSSEQALYPVTIVSINADQLGVWDQDGGRLLRDDRYTIGVWAWEVEQFPDRFCTAFDLVDEVWAISSFCRAAIAAKTDKPVHVIPYQVAEPVATEPLDRPAYGIGDGPYFLFAFDHQSGFERKNPLAVVDAFCQAFEPGEGPQLVIKTINGDRWLPDRERLRFASANRPDIVLIEDYLPPATLAGLMADATAYVSLHRAEGYGLTLAEALALGKPVVATGYSGNLDFMDDDTSLLVPYKLVAVGEGCSPYPAHARWAEPDIGAAAAHLRWIIDNPAQAAELGARARAEVLRSAGITRTAEFVAERVRAAMATLDSRAGSAGRVLDGFAQAGALIQTAPDVRTPSRFPRLARPARAAIYRALAHHDEHTRASLEGLVSAGQQLRCEIEARLAHLEASERALDSRAARTERRQSVLHQQLAEQSRVQRQLEQQLREQQALLDTARSAAAMSCDVTDEADSGRAGGTPGGSVET